MLTIFSQLRESYTRYVILFEEDFFQIWKFLTIFSEHNKTSVTNSIIKKINLFKIEELVALLEKFYQRRIG
jgi:hypothetical protein